MKKDLLQRQNDKGEIEFFTELGEKVEWVTEQNYLFRFSPQIKEKVNSWAAAEPSPIKPEYVKNQTLSDLEAQKDHISISRPKKRINWGIQVPTDTDQTVYVWLDALTNYKTVLDGFENFKGEMIHVIGKDIIKFHCVYWPAFLTACKYPLPKEVIVHGHWKKDNLKMSKSIGNVVDPFELINNYGINAVRAYLLSAGPMYKDTNFEYEDLEQLHDSFIVDGFVNMFFRCTGKKFLKQAESIKLENLQFTSEDIFIMESIKKHVENCVKDLNELNFNNALSHIKEIFSLGNGYLNKHEFWRLVGTPQLDNILYIIYESTRINAILLRPYIPEVSHQILKCLSIDSDSVSLSSLENLFETQDFRIDETERQNTFYKKLIQSEKK